MIPDYWSPREALAVYDFIDELRDEIWNRYQLELIQIMQAERSTNPADWGDEISEDPDDEISF
jgi:hypothetical protein